MKHSIYIYIYLYLYILAHGCIVYDMVAESVRAQGFLVEGPELKSQPSQTNHLQKKSYLLLLRMMLCISRTGHGRRGVAQVEDISIIANWSS